MPSGRTGNSDSGATLFVRRAGTAGTPVVLLHGLASSSRYWLPSLALLSDHHRLLLPDLLGFGRSPKPFASHDSAEEHLAWLRRSLDPLLGAEPFALVGHSMGALVALRYAVEHPQQVTRLALISLPVIGCLPWGHRLDGSPRPLHRLMAHTRAGACTTGLAIRLVAPIGRRIAPRLQPGVPPDAARDALSLTAASYWRTLERVVYGSDVSALLRGLERPLLVVQGAQDRTVPLEPVQALATKFPGMELVVLPEAGHNPWFTHPARTAALLDGFIDQAPGPQAADHHSSEPATVAAN